MKRALLLIFPILAACGEDKPATDPTTSTATAPPPPPPSIMEAGTTAAAVDAAVAPPKPTGPVAAWKATGFQTPESVLWDEANDRYLVSNINGSPMDVDNNGYISVVAPDGKVTTEKWIAGGDKKVKLDAPKGSAIANGTLYVADLTVVRQFDLKTAAQKADIKIPGAVFLNDVAAGADGTVYVSDTGMKLGKNGPEPQGADAVYSIDKTGKVKTVAKTKDLGGPNGLFVQDKNLLVVSFGATGLYRIDDKGKIQDATKLPKGSLDGIVQAGDSLLVSSWEGSAIYKGKLGGTFEAVLENQQSPADIGWDKKRSRVLVPHFMENTVEAYDIK
jgi:sugar lactone lactonase YvrE